MRPSLNKGKDTEAQRQLVHGRSTSKANSPMEAKSGNAGGVAVSEMQRSERIERPGRSFFGGSLMTIRKDWVSFPVMDVKRNEDCVPHQPSTPKAPPCPSNDLSR
jgi:hypothetical protein